MCDPETIYWAWSRCAHQPFWGSLWAGLIAASFTVAGAYYLFKKRLDNDHKRQLERDQSVLEAALFVIMMEVAFNREWAIGLLDAL